MSKVVSLRLREPQVQALRRTARRLGRSPSEAAAILLDEALRQRDFAFIEFRDSAVGRQAYLQGTRLAVWQVAAVAGDYAGDSAQTAAHLGIPIVQVSAALRYAAAYAQETEAAIEDSRCTPEEIARLIPNVEIMAVDEASA
jgi:uncharacterized protein (DUF433 family)